MYERAKQAVARIVCIQMLVHVSCAIAGIDRMHHSGCHARFNAFEAMFVLLAPACIAALPAIPFACGFAS